MLKWYGEQVKARIISNVEIRLKEAGEIVKEEAKKSMPTSLSTGEDVSRSAPGDPPFRQTDELYKSVFSELQPKQLAVKIGTPLKYGRYLEFGTSKMRWRPWLVPALAKSMAKIRMIFAKPIDKGGLFGATETSFGVDSTIDLGKDTSEGINS